MIKPFCDIHKDTEITNPSEIGNFAYFERESSLIKTLSGKKERRAGLIEVKVDLCCECVKKCKEALGL